MEVPQAPHSKRKGSFLRVHLGHIQEPADCEVSTGSLGSNWLPPKSLARPAPRPLPRWTFAPFFVDLPHATRRHKEIAAYNEKDPTDKEQQGQHSQEKKHDTDHDDNRETNIHSRKETTQQNVPETRETTGENVGNPTIGQGKIPEHHQGVARRRQEDQGDTMRQVRNVQ